MPHRESSPKPPHVLILGAGLGGLAAAQVLRKQNIPFSVFESSNSDVPQGWAIGLHTVIKDLIAAMPDDLPPMLETVHHLLPFKLPSQIVFYPFADHNMRIGVTDDGSFDFCRANRYSLRKHLATNIPISYGKTVVGVEEDADGVTAKFADGTTARGDIAIASDGVHSVIRKQILTVPDPQVIIPIGNITGEVTLTGDSFKRMLELGHSAYVVRRPNTRSHFFAGLNQVHPDGKSGDYYWFMVWHDEDCTTQGKDYWTATSSKEKLHAYAIEESHKFDPVLSEIVRETPVSGIVASQIFRGLILDPKVVPVGRTLLIGDAAHSMTPFRGEGGIHALLDGLKVGEGVIKVVQEGTDLIKTMREVQEEVIIRGGEAVRLSTDAIEYDPEKSQGPRMFFGHPAKPVPEENITVSEIPFVS